MKRPHASILITFLLLACLLRAEDAAPTPHTFNLQDGRSLQAKIVSADAEKVVLQRADKLTFDLEPQSFSAADQAYIRKWVIQKRLEAGTLFKLTGTSKVQNLQSAKEDGLLVYTWNCQFEYELKNDTPYDLNNVVIKTDYAKHPGKSENLPGDTDGPNWKHKAQSIRVETLKLGQIMPGSKAPAMKATVLEPGWTWPDGGSAPVSDKLKPLTVTVYYNSVAAAKLTIPPAGPDFNSDKTSTPPSEASH